MKRQPAKLRSAENGNLICARLSEGNSLRQIARELRIESASAITEWARDDAEFAAQYARAREAAYELMADELVELADTPCLIDGRPDNALVQQLRVQIDTRKWVLAKRLPRQYGDRVTQELVGDGERPIVSRIELVAVAPRPRAEDLPAPEGGDEASVSRRKVAIASSR